VGGGQRRLMSLPVLDISSELFPKMSPAMRDVRQVVASPGLVPCAFLDARAEVMKPVMEEHPPELQCLLRRQPVELVGAGMPCLKRTPAALGIPGRVGEESS
jgi:hypothetical protein